MQPTTHTVTTCFEALIHRFKRRMEDTHARSFAKHRHAVDHVPTQILTTAAYAQSTDMLRVYNPILQILAVTAGARGL